MTKTLNQIEDLFNNAQYNNEFQFLLTLLNYKHIASPEESSNLKEWFSALEFYKTLYHEKKDKEKLRIGLLLYSTFFENSDFYNIIGSLCLNSLGFGGSSYLFWKTKKQDRLLGTGEKIRAIKEKLSDCNYNEIIEFFENVHYEQIRNTFFHSAYGISGDDYILFDSEPIEINGTLQRRVSIDNFLNPLIEKVISFFDKFKEIYNESFKSYSEEKLIKGHFPSLKEVIVHGTEDGLKGVTIKNTAQFYGKWSDSSIIFNEQYGFWAATNINFNFPQEETIEIDETLTRYESKSTIKTSDSEFNNLVDKIIERRYEKEMVRIIDLLVKYGNDKYDKWSIETNEHKKESIKKLPLPFYEKVIEINQHLDTTEIQKRIKELK
ncbi:hypothetical protein [Winogradskyella pulchriflava]|uniref:Uncharacterized protein n=1 Tax=Winogradskyella pulchriflava TaxID=1110688 RepID=A0ABV6QC58_9FLAO